MGCKPAGRLRLPVGDSREDLEGGQFIGLGVALLFVLTFLQASQVPQWKRFRLQCRKPGSDPWVRKSPLKKEMATLSSILARRIPCTEEPGKFLGGHKRVRHN